MNVPELSREQKVLVFLLSLPPGHAADIAGGFTSADLTRLRRAIGKLPRLDQDLRKEVYLELQEFYKTPLATLAEEAPYKLSRLLQWHWLGGHFIKLSMGADLHAGLMKKRTGRFNYLSWLGMGTAWSSLDGPHLDESLEPMEYKFSSKTGVLEQGVLSPMSCISSIQMVVKNTWVADSMC